jgi:PAS domain S-box-containing protein
MRLESTTTHGHEHGRAHPDKRRYQQPFAIALTFTLAALVVLIYDDWSSYRYFHQTVLPGSSMMETVGIISHLDEALTMSARMGAVTGDPQWEQRYALLEPQLDTTIQQAKRAAPNVFIGENARQTDEANVALVKMEKRAFELIHRGQRLAADALLASPGYRAQKQAYATGFQSIRTALRERDENHLATMRRELYLSLVFTIAALPLLLLAWSTVLKAIQKHDSERKRAEERLRESEERFRALYENSTIGLYRTTPDGQIILANPSLLKMLGYSSFEELAGRNLENDGFEPAYPRERFIEQIEIHGEVKGLESAWNRNDGSIVFVREGARAVRDSQGTTLYYDGTVEDITERKRVEEERELLVRELKDALENVKTLSGLVPICAHCKKIRDDKGYWNQLEQYLVEHTDANLTHGICPDCTKLYFPEPLGQASPTY